MISNYFGQYLFNQEIILFQTSALTGIQFRHTRNELDFNSVRSDKFLEIRKYHNFLVVFFIKKYVPRLRGSSGLLQRLNKGSILISMKV